LERIGFRSAQPLALNKVAICQLITLSIRDCWLRINLEIKARREAILDHVGAALLADGRKENSFEIKGLIQVRQEISIWRRRVNPPGNVAMIQTRRV